MKRSIVLLATIVLGFCLLGTQAAFADLEGTATSHVFATVSPNMTVSAQANVDAGTVQTGDFSALCTFTIEANTQQVSIYAESTDLWKGDILVDPTDPDYTPPIPLNLSVPIAVGLDLASPLGGADPELVWTGTAGDINGFPSQLTNPLGLESAQVGHFSQDMDLEVTWNQADPEKPQGEYSGYVKLYAMVII